MAQGREIHYLFRFAEREPIRYRVSLEHDQTEPDVLPDWARMDYQLCPHCPLSPEQTGGACLCARDLAPIVALFGDILSYEEVEVEVRTPERTISANTSAQRGLSALIGLVMALSGCPYTAPFRPMAQYHLPFATPDETLFRVASSYLLAQHFRQQAGAEPDWSMQGVEQIYSDLGVVNRHMARRLESAISKDSTVNALVILDLFGVLVPSKIRASLKSLRTLFCSPAGD